MTEKLFYEDCHCKSFEAVVLSCKETDKGFEIILNKTAFYPEGGGQASDFGTISSAHVLHVSESGDQIVHLCDSAIDPGKAVIGTIDWEHRFDLMQQHSGEHIVSGIIHAKFGFHNVGFHMGSDVITIDFDGDVPQDSINEIEMLANTAVFENVPIQCYIPDPDELAQTVYRTKRPLPYPVRIVRIPGYDCCACCGVHVANAGEIGMIKIISSMHFRKGTRMQLVCGTRAVRYLQTVCEQNRIVSQAFSAKPLEVGAAALKMNDTLAAEKYRSSGLLHKLFAITAESYHGKGDTLCVYKDISSGEVRELADMIASVCGGTAVVICPGETSSQFCVINRQSDVQLLGKELSKAINAHGGGKGNAYFGSTCSKMETFISFFVEKMNFSQ